MLCLRIEARVEQHFPRFCEEPLHSGFPRSQPHIAGVNGQEFDNAQYIEGDLWHPVQFEPPVLWNVVRELVPERFLQESD